MIEIPESLALLVVATVASHSSLQANAAVGKVPQRFAAKSHWTGQISGDALRTIFPFVGRGGSISHTRLFFFFFYFLTLTAQTSVANVHRVARFGAALHRNPEAQSVIEHNF
jgi:hypothetical protein